MFLQPGNCLGSHVLGKMILLVVRRLDGCGVLKETRFILGGFSGEETVEVIKAVTRRPNK